MAMKEAKKHHGRIGGNETNTLGVDLISELPDPLIHHILSFVPTIYVVRMSILSKCWRRMWISIPVLYFKEFKDVTFENMVKSQRNIFFKFVSNCQRDMFFKFVSNCLRRRKLSMQFSEDAFITRFKLDMQYHFGVSTNDKIDDWLSIAVQGNVKELDLCIRPSHKRYYFLPKLVLNANSLTSMSLSGLKLMADFPVSLPSLRTLSLGNYYSEDHFSYKALQNLISGCPVLESFRLVTTCSPSKLNLAASGTLKEICLCYVKLTEQWLNNLIIQLPLLEKLCLFRCTGLQVIRIHSHSLRVFSLKVDSPITVLFQTPNLVCFDYAGGAKSIFSIDAPNLLEAYMKLEDRNGFSRPWYSNLVMLLSNLNRLKKLTLYVSSEQVLTIPDCVRKICLPPLPDLKHLKVKIRRALSEDSKLRKAILWCAPNVEILEIEQIKTNSS